MAITLLPFMVTLSLSLRILSYPFEVIKAEKILCYLYLTLNFIHLLIILCLVHFINVFHDIVLLFQYSLLCLLLRYQILLLNRFKVWTRQNFCLC